MFIYSLRASTLKFFAVVCVALVTLITLIAFVPTYGEGSADVPTSGEVDVNYDKIKTEEDRVKFLSQFGWEVKTPAVTSGEASPTSADPQVSTPAPESSNAPTSSVEPGPSWPAVSSIRTEPAKVTVTPPVSTAPSGDEWANVDNDGNN